MQSTREEALFVRKKEKGMERALTRGRLDKSFPLVISLRLDAGGVLEVAASLRFCPLVTDRGGGADSGRLCFEEEEGDEGIWTGDSSFCIGATGVLVRFRADVFLLERGPLEEPGRSDGG